MTFDIPNKDGLWVFNSPLLGIGWQTWVKPTQYNNFIFYVCGGGGGGGVGYSHPTFNGGGGGGGGGGGALVVLNAPSYLLPETLYIQVGRRGLGGVTAGASGQSGAPTYLNYYPTTTNPNNIAFALNGSGGGGGLQNISGTAGAGGGFANNPSIFSYSGSNGGTGGAGGQGVNPAGNFSATTSVIYGGAGGGSRQGSPITSTNGGSILASNIHPQLTGGITNGGNGSAGYLIKRPFTSLGGSGGAGGAGIAGGVGGDGSWGSGGGGSGAGTAASRGGNGGDGFVIIIGY
jgi:hypothetical protein